MTLKGKHIRWVDGFKVRNTNPDFDLIASKLHSGAVFDGRRHPRIPEGELWMDRRFRDEKSFLFKVHKIELAKWPTWTVEATRTYLKRKLCRKGEPQSFVVRRERRRSGIAIVYVRGNVVRQWIDPSFIFGGHHEVYDYIPSGEVWIDIKQDPREVPFTIAHELYELTLMAKGVAYDPAHRQATDMEHALRQKWLHHNRAKPLRMKPFWQSKDGYCGPATLVIASAYFGYQYKETEIEELCRKQSNRRRGTKAYGTDHAELIGASKALGAEVHAEQDASIEDMRHWVMRKRVPIVIGWTPPGGDHFSVVYHLTKTHVYLMDPDKEAAPSGRRKVSLQRFMRLWYDTDTARNIRVDRWFMAVSFKHKVAA